MTNAKTITAFKSKMIFVSLVLVYLSGVSSHSYAVEGTSSLKAQAVSPSHFDQPRRNRPFPQIQRLVNQYIEEQIAIGNIDPTEYNRLKQERNQLREQLKSLKESGDSEAVQQKLTEIRQQQRAQQAYARSVLDNSVELQQRISDKRYQLRRQKLERQLDMLERRRERVQDRRRGESTQ